ncbi:hypothetical protein F4813DRAFT_387691 [Daldinia decipiens]|uniref:uncharacterized protein n=1 Tax=Daldinia decipiens TaxID=326647 RepID=UPI0020C537A6|nr:uncharacterized protein F4813DRAFT_387691 [Daldinia decipiens]KAI1659584.1 hypothetical protein F4813DRAFT_387691 [Daldinia decipiens]
MSIGTNIVADFFTENNSLADGDDEDEGSQVRNTSSHHPTRHPALRDEAAARVPVSVDVAQYAPDHVYAHENVDIQLDAKCGGETMAVYGLGSIDRLGLHPDAGRKVVSTQCRWRQNFGIHKNKEYRLDSLAKATDTCELRQNMGAAKLAAATGGLRQGSPGQFLLRRIIMYVNTVIAVFFGFCFIVTRYR